MYEEYTDEKLRGERDCFYCLDGRVYLGFVADDAEEVFEVVTCRKCHGTGVLVDD